MKKVIIGVTIFAVFGCTRDDVSGIVNGNTSGQIANVRQVVFKDLFAGDATTTIQFQYSAGKVQRIAWDFNYPLGGISSSFQEERFYSSDGLLLSLKSGKFNGGKLNLLYTYKDGLKSSIVTTRNDTITSITKFIGYDNKNPTHIENLFGVYGIDNTFNYPHYTILEFDVRGNLTSQHHSGIPGFESVTEEKKITYSDELNPLRNLIETPLQQAFEFYDDLSFYFSTNLPSSIEANYPYVDPVYNRTDLEYTKDAEGRITHATASGHAGVIRYTLDIMYN